MAEPQQTEDFHPLWWVRLCQRYGQHPQDPDAFWFWAGPRLKHAVLEAKDQYGDRRVDIYGEGFEPL